VLSTARHSAGTLPKQKRSSPELNDQDLSDQATTGDMIIGIGLWHADPAARRYGQRLRARGKKGGVIGCAMANRANKIAYALGPGPVWLRPRPLGLTAPGIPRSLPNSDAQSSARRPQEGADLDPFSSSSSARMASRAMVADSKETWVCSYLSLTLLLGVGAYAVLGWWWADPVGALAMLPIILCQGWETLAEARVPAGLD
jgi:hypothetical protein